MFVNILNIQVYYQQNMLYIIFINYFHDFYRMPCVRCGGVVVRTTDSQSREPGSESPCYRFESWTISLNSRCSGSISRIIEYLAIYSGGYVNE